MWDRHHFKKERHNRNYKYNSFYDQLILFPCCFTLYLHVILYRYKELTLQSEQSRFEPHDCLHEPEMPSHTSSKEADNLASTWSHRNSSVKGHLDHDSIFGHQPTKFHRKRFTIFFLTQEHSITDFGKIFNFRLPDFQFSPIILYHNEAHYPLLHLDRIPNPGSFIQLGWHNSTPNTSF